MVRHRPKDMPAELCSTGEQKALLVGIALSHARLTGEFLGFADVEIEPDLVEGSFAARIVGREDDGWPEDARLHAKWRVAEKKVITTLVVRSP